MGWFSTLFGIGKQKKVNVLVVGLDNSGKSTIIETLKPQNLRDFEIAPTVGFNVERFSRKGLDFTVFDMSGGVRYRNLWESYFKDVSAVIFVVDSADRLRLVVSKDELENMIKHPDLKSNVPLLVFANKSDLPDAQLPSEIAGALDLNNLTDRSWQIFPSNALTGSGIPEGSDWLAEQLR